MSLSLKTVKGVMTLTWSSPTMEASWKIAPQMTEEEMLGTLTQMVSFVRQQRGATQMEIAKLETELGMRPAAPATAPSPVPAPSATPVPPTGPGKILMGPPTTLTDAPAGGAPARSDVDWSSMPSTTVPEHLQKAWEMVPPEEQSW